MPTIRITPRAAEFVARVRAARRGALTFTIDGGCCEGTAPHLFEDAVLAGVDPVGQAAGVPVYLQAAMCSLYADAEVTIDVIDEPMSDAMSLETEYGVRFVLREPPRPVEAAPAGSTMLVALARRLVEQLAADAPEMSGEPSSLPVSHYHSEDRLAAERATLFRRYPIPIAHASEIGPGTCRRHDALGLPLLLVGDEAGEARCFLNVCRHRGMRLVGDETCQRKGLVCPYHGWTYGLDGALRHMPHAAAFPTTSPETHGLVEVPLVRRHGLLWVRPTPATSDGPLDLDAFLGPIGGELDAFDLASHVLYRRIDTVRRCNWKLVIDAFLEAYHIRTLHRDTIYRFFLDARAASDFVGPHVRSVTARRPAATLVGTAPATWNLREDFTFTHFVFPSSVFIFHPDYVSHIVVYPVDPDHVRWTHAMLVPGARATDEHRPHWDKTLALIEETVFQREDLFAAEGIQAGLRSGANDTVTFGRLEDGLRHFHDAIARAIADAGAA